MKKQPVLRRLAGLVALACLSPASSQAGTLNLANAPLTVSTSVDPNVMLLLDNSGSMDNIIWANGYSNTTSYAHWGTYDPWGTDSLWSAKDGNINVGSMVYCGSYPDTTWKAGYRDGKLKCLRLPDPVGSGSTRYSGNYLNYLFSTYPNNTNLRTGEIPSDHRMKVARDVASALVTNTTGMRFGVARFYGPDTQNHGHGARIDAGCGSSTKTITDAIAGYKSETNTPLAEALYEVTRYFRGMESYYRKDDGKPVPHTSPIQYRCQKNFTIVVTDGLPTYDTTFPTNDPDDTADADRSLPDWDGETPTTTQAMYPNFPKHSDGFDPDDGSAGEGASLYLDDIAKFAWDIDMKTSGNDLSGVSFDAADFPKQNMYTYTVGFSTSNQMLEDTAEYGHGEYSTANSASELTAALQSALADIMEKSASSASAAANTGYIGTGTKVYQARFNSKDWSGQLLAFDFDTDPKSKTYGSLKTNGSGPGGSKWDAGSELPGWSSRNIFTLSEGDGVPFTWTALSDAQKTLLGSENVLEYLRGNDALEVKNGGSFRNRITKLGDLVNSAPSFIGKPGFRYPDTLESDTPTTAQKYSEFVKTHADRTKMIYVGANDGMLHGFDAETGVEKMAYIPEAVLPNLSKLSSTGYEHRYFVDGTPTVVDAFIGGAWKTILVGGLNKGGQAIYALDVTDPTRFGQTSVNAQNLVLWEFTDRNDADLGYTYSQPAIVRLPSGVWAAVFGNGYNNTEADGSASTDGDAVIYMVNLATGALIQKFDTGVGMDEDPTETGRPNGFATLAPVDVNGDTNVDAIYGGDLFGNLWKLEYKNKTNQWGFALAGKPIFTACAESPCINRQPITVRPDVGRPPTGSGVLVYFGTGKYLETGDNNGANGGKQSFYAVWDRTSADNKAATLDRSSLVEQKILHETAAYRVTSDYAVDWTSKRGWYLDLVPSSATPAGERQVTNPLLRNNRIIFTTIIPTDDKCVAGGPSWLMEMDARTGSRLTYSPFDVNGDRGFDAKDLITYTNDEGEEVSVPASGTRTGDAAATPTVMSCEGPDCERKVVSSSKGIETITENPGPYDTGRQSWRELGL